MCNHVYITSCRSAPKAGGAPSIPCGPVRPLTSPSLAALIECEKDLAPTLPSLAEGEGAKGEAPAAFVSEVRGSLSRRAIPDVLSVKSSILMSPCTV